MMVDYSLFMVILTCVMAVNGPACEDDIVITPGFKDSFPSCWHKGSYSTMQIQDRMPKKIEVGTVWTEVQSFECIHTRVPRDE